MKYCSKCGKELIDEAVVCPACGAPTDGQNKPAANDGKSFGFALLGFCIPIVGLILYLVWKDSTPLKAKSAGKGALVSVIVSVVIYIIYAILIAIGLAGMTTGMMMY
ncbi:MAG: zinc ribbon domain-containing protein [Clostridia bacterium]|nr:zinc ribbon domain-containing protein [Clostridia bacterium]